MNQSYLVQRLKLPYKGCDSNPFNFGGGLARGGIKENAYKSLNQIFRFDYMGSAEFEFGAVPKTLDRIFRYYAEGKSVKGRMCIHGIPVYYLCHEVNKVEVGERIKELASWGYRSKTKEAVLLDEALAARVPDTVVPEKAEKYKGYKEYIGWLELNNDFIFFLDKEKLERFVELLEAFATAMKEMHIQESANTDQGENICQ